MNLTRKSRPLIPITVPIDEPEDPPLRRFVWLKRLLLLGAVLVLLVFLSRAWLLHREERRLAAEIAKWKTAGLPILEADFQTPPVPDNENAAIAVLRAARALTQVEKLHQLDEQYQFEQMPWSQETTRAAEDFLARARPALTSMHLARSLTRTRWDIPGRDDFLSSHDEHKPDWNAFRELANVLALDARAAVGRGDHESFLNDLSDMHFIARVQAQEPSVLSDLVSIGIDSLAARLATLHAHELDLSNRSARSLSQRIIDQWLMDSDRGSSAPTVMAREASLYCETLQDQASDYVMRMASGTRADPRILDRWTRLALRPVRLRHGSAVLALFRAEVEQASSPNWPAFVRRGSKASWEPSFSGVEPLDSAMNFVTLSSGPLDRYFLTRFRHRLNARFAGISLGARRYALDHHGAFPKQLSDLVPEYLRAVPLDPFDPNDAPLRYVYSASQPYVYSVGERGADLIANGKFVPTFSTEVDWRAPNAVSYLIPGANGASTVPIAHPPTSSGK